jgi:hypothetical protein
MPGLLLKWISFGNWAWCEGGSVSKPPKPFAGFMFEEFKPKEKFSMAKMDSPSYLLPSVNAVSKLLFGKKISMRQTMRLAEEHYNVPSLVSDSSLDNFYGNGVGKGVLEKLLAFWRRIIPLKSLKAIIFEMGKMGDVPHGSNCIGWISGVVGFGMHGHEEFEPLMAFLKTRAYQEKAFIEGVITFRNVEQETLTAEGFAFVRKQHGEITELDDVTLDIVNDSFQEVMAKRQPPGNTKMLTAMVKLHLDFYFE